MTTTAHNRGHQDALTADLLAKASTGDISAVEAALGRFKGADAIAAARLAVDAARRADRWDNLAYLADFLHDVSAHGGRDDESSDDDGVSAGDRAKIADASTLSYVTPLDAPAGMVKKGGADTRNLSVFVQNRVPTRTEVVTFEVVDENAPVGEYRSVEDPSPYVSIADPEEDISLMRGADDCIVDAPTIRVLYSYPFETAGPSPEEKEAGGWIFEEMAPNGRFFTRAGLARAVAARYNAIYDEEAKTTTIEPGYIPGMLNRNRTNGRYGIWGHVIGDLVLHTVEHDPVTGIYTLGIDS